MSTETKEQFRNDPRRKIERTTGIPIRTEGTPQGYQMKDELGGIAFRPDNHLRRVVNGPTSSIDKPYFRITNSADDQPAQVMIYDQIGKSYWSEEGTGAKEFRQEFQKIPKNKKIDLRINSNGGNVFEGIAIYNTIKERSEDVTCHIDGAALSIASVIALAASKVCMPKTAQLMIHDPATYAEGTEADMQKAINALRSCREAILAAYVAKTGKAKEDLAALMVAETWYQGQSAKEYGFVDEVTDAAPITNTFDLSAFRNVPEAFRKITNAAAQGSRHQNTDMKDTIVALLKEHGETVADNATVEQLNAQLKTVLSKAKDKPAELQKAEGADIKAMGDLLKQITSERDAERKTRIEGVVDTCIAERRVTADQRDKWISRALKDETILTDIKAMAPNIPPPGIGVVETGASIDAVSKHITRLSNEIPIDIKDRNDSLVSAKAKSRASHIRKHEAALTEVFNAGTNTVDTTLKQDVLTDIGLRAFARILAPFSAFTTKFENVALRGTNIVTVPFLDLETAASTDWVAGNGYVAGDTTRDKRQVTINKRKYQGLSYTSDELARQPFLMIAETFALKGEKLAYDVWLDILGLVLAANYGQATKTDTTAVSPKPLGAWDSNALADLQQVANELNWPKPGRQLFVNASLDNQLKKDNSVKLALNIGGTEVMREGRMPNLFGFNYSTNPYLPSNAESLIGFIAWKTAILLATAPIPPTEEVLRNGTQYSVAVDPDTGIAMEMRSFGNSQLDTSLRFIECNYGFAKGNASALKRITTA